MPFWAECPVRPESAYSPLAGLPLRSGSLSSAWAASRRGAFVGSLAVGKAEAASPVATMAVETRPELVGKRFLCVAVGEEARPERGQSRGSWRGWRAGVIRAVSHRDSRSPDLAVREQRPSVAQPAPAPGGLPLTSSLRPATGGHAPLPPCRRLGPLGRGRSLPERSFPDGSGDRAGPPSVRPGPGLRGLAAVLQGVGRSFPCGSQAAAVAFPKGGAAGLARRGQVCV